MVRIPLLDVNVLVALAWPSHVHHASARAWFRRIRQDGWATCPLTQGGFVRISSNPRIFPEATSPAGAMAALKRLVQVGRHEFWVDDVDFTDLPEAERVVGYRQVTDAHLLALALRKGGCLATFDRAVLDLVPSTEDAQEALRILSPV